MPQGGVSRARRSTGCSGLLQALGTAGIPSPWNADGACPSLQRQLDLVLLVPELTFLTGLSDLRKNSRMLKVRARLIPAFPRVWEEPQALPHPSGCSLVQDVMWEMIQSPQQHYQRLTSLLRRVRDTPEASRELERWGLCLDTDIYRVRAAGLPALPWPWGQWRRQLRSSLLCPDPGSRAAHGAHQPPAPLLPSHRGPGLAPGGDQGGAHCCGEQQLPSPLGLESFGIGFPECWCFG